MNLDSCFKRGLLKKIRPDPENAKRSLELSKTNLEDARANLKIKRPRVVAISSYTAMFHAARALLYRDGIKERSHECIPIYIRERYPDLEGLANTLDSYRRFRHNALYGLDFTLNIKEAQSTLKDAEEFMEKIKEILGESTHDQLE